MTEIEYKLQFLGFQRQNHKYSFSNQIVNYSSIYTYSSNKKIKFFIIMIL